MQELYGFAVLFLARLSVQVEQHTALVHVVEVVGVLGIAEHSAVVAHIEIYEVLGEVKVLLLARYLRGIEQRGYHAAVDVVPFERLALKYTFDVPERLVGRGTLYEPSDIVFDVLVHYYPRKLADIVRYELFALAAVHADVLHRELSYIVKIHSRSA